MKKLILMILPLLLLGSTFAYWDKFERDVVDTVNMVRQAQGLQNLYESPVLDYISMKHCEYMLTDPTKCVGHYCGDGTPEQRFNPVLKKRGSNAYYRGEDLTERNYTSAGVVLAFWNSPIHKKVMMNPIYRRVGFYSRDGFSCLIFSDATDGI